MYIVQILNEFDFYVFPAYKEAKEFYDKKVNDRESECILIKVLESNVNLNDLAD